MHVLPTHGNHTWPEFGNDVFIGTIVSQYKLFPALSVP